VAGLAAAYLGREAFGLRVPVPQLRRQVPDWWRTFFPFAPAAFLYGVGLGIGFLTYLAHGSLLVVSATAVASGKPLVGAVLVGAFGLARGASAVVARRARTPEEGSELVGRLARASAWGGWRLAHGLALGAVLVAATATAGNAGPAEAGTLAAATLSIAFGAAGIAKVARPGAWRRALGSYGLPAPLERAALVAVPAAELALSSLPFLGLASTAGLAALVLLAAFSVAIVLARIRRGPRLACGCFGAATTRDYRHLLARNAALALAAVAAWRQGVDASILRSPGAPSGTDLLPAVLVMVGLGLAIWVGAQAVPLMRRGSRR
jgi:hypothetical protein